ncbi:Aspartyl aminopeptidase [Gracilaria domingensis]|nr:Aspartyl aminopeptidase [Gracilaria domingensis]
MLSEASFQTISQTDDWSKVLRAGGRYMFSSHGSSIVAFSVPDSIDGSEFAFNVIGAHTDSPCFKVKPVSKLAAYGYLQVGVECYGGGLWHTWFDRDLTVAGRVIVRTADGKHSVKLVSVEKPILRIPNLAIHLSRNVNTDGFKVNKETDTRPVLATQVAVAIDQIMNSTADGDANGTAHEGKKESSQASKRHAPLLLKVLADELNVSPKEIVDLDLCVADTQPAAIGGALDEFVFAPRLDNLASCFTATQSLIDALNEGDEEDVPQVCRMITCFDHEEIGSRSSHGADSPLLSSTMERICAALNVSHGRVLPRSLLISADMAHAIHPNYHSKHENNHRPALGCGLVVKTNQNQRYATSGVSGFLVREAARQAGDVSIQEFVVPNDKPCGSTIGPLLSSRTGLRTVDVGQAQLSMHSIREMCSALDFSLVIDVLKELLKNQSAILASMERLEL